MRCNEALFGQTFRQAGFDQSQRSARSLQTCRGPSVDTTLNIAAHCLGVWTENYQLTLMDSTACAQNSTTALPRRANPLPQWAKVWRAPMWTRSWKGGAGREVRSGGVANQAGKQLLSSCHTSQPRHLRPWLTVTVCAHGLSPSPQSQKQLAVRCKESAGRPDYHITAAVTRWLPGSLGCRPHLHAAMQEECQQQNTTVLVLLYNQREQRQLTA